MFGGESHRPGKRPAVAGFAFSEGRSCGDKNDGAAPTDIEITPRRYVFLFSVKLLATTPKSPDFVSPLAIVKPSALKPRRSNSRTADARLGM
jgi:hypothetical protein